MEIEGRSTKVSTKLLVFVTLDEFGFNSENSAEVVLLCFHERFHEHFHELYSDFLILAAVRPAEFRITDT